MNEWKAGIYDGVECIKNEHGKFDCELTPVGYYANINKEKEIWNDIDVIITDTNTSIRNDEIKIWCAGKILKCYETYRGVARRMECRCESPAGLKKEERDEIFKMLKEYYEHEHRFPRRVK